MLDLQSILIVSLSFVTVAATVVALGQYYRSYAQTLRRLPTPLRSSQEASARSHHGIRGYMVRYFKDTKLGGDSVFREQLRRKLQKAGFFGRDAVTFYILTKIVLLLVFPAVVYLIIGLFLVAIPWLVKLAVVLIAGLIAFFGPDIYLARKRRMLIRRYRLMFPNVLDLLVVCVDAGLTLETAFDRVKPEVLKQNREFGINLEMMGAEMRAGRSMIEALETLSNRLGLEEARSFVSILRQSIELGSDVSDALRVFSDEMRDKRLLRAEEAASKLSVKMVLPLGLFIFPVVLLVVLLPVIIKLMAVLR
jgi:tight adherence protein C